MTDCSVILTGIAQQHWWRLVACCCCEHFQLRMALRTCCAEEDRARMRFLCNAFDPPVFVFAPCTTSTPAPPPSPSCDDGLCDWRRNTALYQSQCHPEQMLAPPFPCPHICAISSFSHVHLFVLYFPMCREWGDANTLGQPFLANFSVLCSVNALKLLSPSKNILTHTIHAALRRHGNSEFCGPPCWSSWWSSLKCSGIPSKQKMSN
jgi:hypothetical protein